MVIQLIYDGWQREHDSFYQENIHEVARQFYGHDPRMMDIVQSQ